MSTNRPAGEPTMQWFKNLSIPTRLTAAFAVMALRAQAEREQAQAAERRVKVDCLLAVVDAAAAGDLTQSIAVTGEDSVGRIGRGLEEFLDDLRRSVAAIAENAQTIAGSSE